MRARIRRRRLAGARGRLPAHRRALPRTRRQHPATAPPAPGAVRGQELSRLIRRAAAGDAEARERAALANLNLVRHVVRRYRSFGHDADELFQVGCIGLLKAVDRFDPERGTRFSTYAVPLILGEIQRHLRDAAPAGLGRGAFRLAQAARSAGERLAGALGRAPTAAEVAEAVGATVADLAAALEAARRPASLDEVGSGGGDGGRALHERLPGPGGEIWDHAALRELVRGLPARERRVILLRYFRDLSQAEAGSLLGLSQPQISRLEKRALQALRHQWQDQVQG